MPFGFRRNSCEKMLADGLPVGAGSITQNNTFGENIWTDIIVCARGVELEIFEVFSRGYKIPRKWTSNRICIGNVFFSKLAFQNKRNRRVLVMADIIGCFFQRKR